MISWTQSDNYIICKYNENDIKLNKSIAGFDLDHTIIKPKSGKKFPINQNDWMLYDDSVIEKLQNFSETHQLVIVTNQKILSKNPDNIPEWKNKIHDIVITIDRPILVLASLCSDNFRKPFTKLWDMYIKNTSTDSFYCGDAGGLSARKICNKKVCKDFSDSDKKFAVNLGINFVHRDEFIYGLSYDEQYKKSVSYPVNFSNIRRGTYTFTPSDKKELIIMIGYPGSGKSYYVKNYILQHDNYVYISQDELKTKKKVIQNIYDNLTLGNSIVLDNTNPSKLIRKEYIDIAKKFNILCRCIEFSTSFDHSYHNNMYRSTITQKYVPIVAYRIYRKKYEKPVASEGFYAIDTIDFTLDEDFNDPTYEKYYF